jgi:hypothetical protein
VEPGEPFTYVASLQNIGPLPIRVLGLWDPELTVDPPGEAAVPLGIAMSRDPAAPTGLPEDTVPFRPIDVWPGQEVVFVVGEVGGECANGDRLQDLEDSFSFVGIPIVYEVLGWRQEASVALWSGVSVPREPDCGDDR